jgi:hypothetical protein
MRELPARFNPGVSSSIDFAPSLLHYLNFKNSKNPFLGESIFGKSDSVERRASLSSFADESYLNTKEKSYYGKHPGGYKLELYLFDRYIRYVHKIEKENRLWNLPN